jgi:hypothetical protein
MVVVGWDHASWGWRQWTLGMGMRLWCILLGVVCGRAMLWREQYFSISAWGRESGAATTVGTSGGSHVVEGTDLGRVLVWHTAWGACGSELG